VILDALHNAWNSVLDFATKLVVPDWGSLVNLMPIFLFIGVIGPAVSIGILLWLYYFVSKPRTGVTFDEGPHPATLDADRQPIFPVGEPYCARHARVFPSGATRCDLDREELLSVVCPKCGSGRAAEISTCGNCGLVLKIAPRARVLRPAGPTPGGAASA
jgi:hypothetical protein